MMQIGNIASDDLVQAVTLVISLIGIVLWLRWGRGRIAYAVSPIAFLIHRVIFYIVIIINPHLNNDLVVMWSSALSLHAVIVIASAAVMMLVISRRGVRV